MIDEVILERLSLSVGRIKEISKEPLLKEPLGGYFKDVASFLVLLHETYKTCQNGKLKSMELPELESLNHKLYCDILSDNYDKSWANPQYIAHVFEKAGLPLDYARALCFLYAELRGLIPYVFEKRTDVITSFYELFIQVYGMFTVSETEDDEKVMIGDEEIIQEVDGYFDGLISVPEAGDIIKVLYEFEDDNCEELLEDRLLDQLDETRDFATRIILDENLEDIRYLYYYGEYISEDEIKVAKFLNSLSEDDIVKMASTYTEGYRIGFVKDKKPLDKKETVNIRYPLGFERMVKRAIFNFDAMGLKPTIYRAAGLSINKNNHFRIGYSGAIPNRQFEYDHQDDRALFFDAKHVNRRIRILGELYEKHKKLANVHAGPAVIETFGENPFVPQSKKEAIKLDKSQQKLASSYAVEAGNITNKYIIGEERSFTIIAYPIPQIGVEFEEIFKRTVELNSLDYKVYESIQQTLIDALDKADEVVIKGTNGNETDLTIKLYELEDPEHQTKFENCVADVNIPVGEVFTSPVLKGTNGLLHVSQVYLEGLMYKNLKVYLKDGCVEKYSCANFPKVSDNEKYFKENVLFNHESLPIGEFAIGTNTTAYKMAKNFRIEDRLPILIGEKTGPHFALGDTCYSRAEDVKVYNPDGKEIISKENDFSRLRNDDPSKAYFSCHTDITIPYDELGSIIARTPDGDVPIILDGRFVLPGTEELNAPLCDAK